MNLPESLRAHTFSHYPILHIITYDDAEVDTLIFEIDPERKIIEWNMARGLVRFDNKQPLMAWCDLAGALDNLPSWLAFLHPASSEGKDIALWIVLTCAIVMAAGTASGGWKIIKTLGHKMVKLHPIHGFAAETSSATILTVAAHFGMPVSTTHSISTAIMGVGFAKNPKALKLGVIERIVWAWILTIPAAGGIAYGLWRLLEALGWA